MRLKTLASVSELTALKALEEPTSTTLSSVSVQEVEIASRNWAAVRELGRNEARAGNNESNQSTGNKLKQRIT
jgi:hypothetical protein